MPIPARKSILLEVSGYEADLLSFLNVCQFIEKCGVIGTCQSIKLVVDGDGSARLRFKLAGGELPILRDVSEIKELWIGE